MRFRLRTLLIVVTLICVYFGAWRWRERNFHSHIRQYAQSRGRVANGTYTIVPFVVKARELNEAKSKETWNYYIDLRLMLVKLPYERDSRPGWPYYYAPVAERPMWFHD